MEAELNHTRKEEQTRKEIPEEKAIPGVKMDNQQPKKEKNQNQEENRSKKGAKGNVQSRITKRSGRT